METTTTSKLNFLFNVLKITALVFIAGTVINWLIYFFIDSFDTSTQEKNTQFVNLVDTVLLITQLGMGIFALALFFSKKALYKYLGALFLFVPVMPHIINLLAGDDPSDKYYFLFELQGYVVMLLAYLLAPALLSAYETRFSKVFTLLSIFSFFLWGTLLVNQHKAIDILGTRFSGYSVVDLQYTLAQIPFIILIGILGFYARKLEIFTMDKSTKKS